MIRGGTLRTTDQGLDYAKDKGVEVTKEFVNSCNENEDSTKQEGSTNVDTQNNCSDSNCSDN